MWLSDRQQQPKLLTQLRRVVRSKHYSNRTEESYVAWVRRYVHFQALSAVLFLYRDVYRDVLHRDVGNIGELIRAKQPARLPVVLTREEVRAVLQP
jgi:hypothetical protein